MKTLKKVLCLFIFFIIFIQLLSGCHRQIPYNAVMYGDIYENRSFFYDEFYEKNLTEGSWSDKQKDYVSGENYPKERTLIIDNEIDFNGTLKDCPMDIDFNKSILILHCFTTASSSKYEIKNIIKEDKSIVIYYTQSKSKGKTPPNASMPLTKWIIVIMDKLDFETVQFTFCK